MLTLLDMKTLKAPSGKAAEMLADAGFKSGLAAGLKQFLPTKRWYSAKDDTIDDVSVLAVAPIADGTCFTVINVALASGSKIMFLIPLRAAFGEKANDLMKNSPDFIIAPVEAGDETGFIFDAAGESDFSAGLLALMEKDAALSLPSGMTLCADATAAGKEKIKAVHGLPQKMMGVEQSNTSLIIGKQVMLKMYRRVSFGSQPEIATSAFLTETAGFKNTPAYLGKAVLRFADGKEIALAVLQDFVLNEGDGWGYTMNYLKALFDGVLKKQTAVNHEDYLKKACLLGQRTAEMHRAFAKGTEGVFKPEPVSDADLTDWADAALAQADRTIAVAKANVEPLSGEVRKQVEALIAGREKIAARIKELTPASVQCVKTRFHGDYHLGQVVVANGDFILLDFEGEPLRPMEERQISHSVLRDVAGMVRSFDYAAFGSLLMYVLPENRAALHPVAADWCKQATTAFLHGYFDTMKGSSSVPADKDAARALLDLFVLEKALYEVIYEVANRPDWLPIPMNGVARLINFDGE